MGVGGCITSALPNEPPATLSPPEGKLFQTASAAAPFYPLQDADSLEGDDVVRCVPLILAPWKCCCKLNIHFQVAPLNEGEGFVQSIYLSTSLLNSSVTCSFLPHFSKCQDE